MFAVFCWLLLGLAQYSSFFISQYTVVLKIRSRQRIGKREQESIDFVYTWSWPKAKYTPRYKKWETRQGNWIPEKLKKKTIRINIFQVFTTGTNMRWYCFVGWGLPVFMTTIWAVATAYFHEARWAKTCCVNIVSYRQFLAFHRRCLHGFSKHWSRGQTRSTLCWEIPDTASYAWVIHVFPYVRSEQLCFWDTKGDKIKGYGWTFSACTTEVQCLFPLRYVTRVTCRFASRASSAKATKFHSSEKLAPDL